MQNRNSTRRGPVGNRMTVEELLILAKDRNHIVKSFEVGIRDKNHVPKQSRVFLICGICGNEWDTKVQVYVERQSASNGCRQCYTANQQNPTIYPNSPFQPQTTTTRRSGVNALRQANQQSQFGHIQSRSDLIQFLTQQGDDYSKKVLPLVQRDDLLKANQQSLQGPVSKHHVIPLHAGGSPDAWNLIVVTKMEHHDLHVVRYETFGEQNDLTATFGTQADLIAAYGQNAMVGLPSLVSSKPKQKQSQAVQRAPLELKEAFKKGTVWTHEDGTIIRFTPNQIQSTPQLKEALIKALPTHHKARLALEKNPTSQNNLRSLIITTLPLASTVLPSKPKTSAYGFTVSYLT